MYFEIVVVVVVADAAIVIFGTGFWDVLGQEGGTRELFSSV